MSWFSDEAHRAWLYRILLALVTLAALYGIIGENEVAGWTGLVTAVVGNGLATLNTTTRKELPPADDGGDPTLY